MTFEIGESTKRKIEVKDVDNVFIDPTTITITIWKPDGSKVVDAQVMTSSSNGCYYYWYTIGEQTGTHRILFEATMDSKVAKTRDDITVISEKK